MARCSQASTCRRLTVSSEAPRRRRRARKPPPAAMEANWRSSPTSTTLAPARSACRAGGELAGGDHGRLVHHQHRPAVQLSPATAEVEQEPVDRAGVGEAFVGQADGGDPGRGGAEDLVAVQLERLPGQPQRPGLADPARPTTTATPAPPWVRSRTMAAWSSPAVVWRSRTWRTSSGRTTAQPSPARRWRRPPVGAPGPAAPAWRTGPPPAAGRGRPGPPARPRNRSAPPPPG